MGLGGLAKKIGRVASGGSIANRLLGTEDSKKQAKQAENQAYQQAAFQRMMFDTFQNESAPIRGLRDQYLGHYQDLIKGNTGDFMKGPEYNNVYNAGASIADTAQNPALRSALLDRAKNTALGEFQNYYNRIATGADVSGAGVNSTNSLLSQNVANQSALLHGGINQVSDILQNSANSNRQATSGILGLVGSFMSDARAKENAVKVGVDSDGLDVYEYNYIGKPERYRSKMAQDIIKIDPEHVHMNSDGFLMVSGKYKPVRVS